MIEIKLSFASFEDIDPDTRKLVAAALGIPMSLLGTAASNNEQAPEEPAQPAVAENTGSVSFESFTASPRGDDAAQETAVEEPLAATGVTTRQDVEEALRKLIEDKGIEAAHKVLADFGAPRISALPSHSYADVRYACLSLMNDAP